MIVYATAPVSAVVEAFTVENQAMGAPSSLWKRYAKVAGISRHGFFLYFADRRRGVGIQVGDVLATSKPLSLAADLGVTRPPQSFQYLDANTAEPALAGMTPVT